MRVVEIEEENLEESRRKEDKEELYLAKRIGKNLTFLITHRSLHNKMLSSSNN